MARGHLGGAAESVDAHARHSAMPFRWVGLRSARGTAKPGRAGRPASDRPSGLVSLLVRVAKGAAGFVVMVGLWEVTSFAGILKPSAAPSAGEFVSALVTSLHAGALAATAATIEAWGITVLLSVAIGCVIGLLTGISSWLNAVTSVFFDFVRPLPPIAILPAVIVIVGVGQSLEVIIAITAAVWPVLLGAHYGVSHADPRMIDTGRAMQLGRAKRLYRIIIPSALPSIATGMRLTAIIALAAVIGVELVGGTGHGLGSYVATATSTGATNQAYAGAFIAAILGLAITGIFFLVERRVLRWTTSYR
jgi:ABC-type nitrate/sulfonate/bicarbonate transport system permease component